MMVVSTEKIKVILLIKACLLRRGVEQALAHSDAIEISSVIDLSEISYLNAGFSGGVAIVDIDMPRLNGLKMVRAVQEMNLPVAVVFLTMYNELDVFDAAIKLGVKGYILKENAAEDIIVALDKVVHGGNFISPSMYEKSQQRSDRVQPLPLSKPQLDQLTPAEKHILKLIAEDRTSKEIADLLQISFRTVEKHRLNICNKLKLHGSHSLLKFAFDHKMHL